MKPHYLLSVSVLIILATANCFAIGKTKSNTAKSTYQSAKQEIEKMLNGTTTPNYERAIYLVENAWNDNQLSNTDFTGAIDKHENEILQLMVSNWHPPTEDSLNMLLPSGNAVKTYATALANWAIYKYMTDTTFFNGNKSSYHEPYRYSTGDPMGSLNWENTQVSHLNKTSIGNCFALASMFKIFSDRLASEAILCTAPGHIYIRHADDKGTYYNVEVGGRDFPGTGTISTLTFSTSQAIKNNIALRELNNQQAIGLCLVYLAKGYEHKYNNKTADFITDCANTTLAYDPNNLSAMLLKAGVMETKLAMQHKPVDQLQSDKNFIAYQQLITKLYQLGYREMPGDVKNLLVKTFTIDSVRALQTTAYSATTRYASLSWGMIDEVHRTATTERFGHTIFDTKTQKITGFAKPDNMLNNYNFDAAVFAWNVDPMTKGLPDFSPYVAFNNNPVLLVDETGGFSIKNHKAITKAALKTLGIKDFFYNKILILGVIKPDILNNQSDRHFDNRVNKTEIDKSWNKLNAQISDANNPFELGDKLHTVQDFYSHSNYVELFIDFFKWKGGDIQTLKPEDIPTYNSAGDDFKKYLADQEDNFRTGDYNILTDAFPGKKQKQKIKDNPNHHENKNKDAADIEKHPHGAELATPNFNYNTAAEAVAQKATEEILKSQQTP